MSDVIKPEGRLDLTAVSDFHAKLLARDKDPAVVDLSAVTHIGALCLQTLIAAGRRPNGLRLCGVGDHLLAQMNTMGLTPEKIMEGHHEP